MARGRPSERSIFFPWERRGSVLRRIRIEVGPILVVGAVAGLVALVAVHERREAGIRRTRATILNLRTAVDNYMADHDGGCPADGLVRIVGEAPGAEEGARNAWGKPLRLECPGSDHARYDLSSDGPDGKPGGLDRIE
jgi:hypothetical protein